MPSLSRRTMLSGGLALGGTALLGRKDGASPWLDENPQREVLAIGRGDVRYPSLTRGQNQRFTSTPESVLLPRCTADVVQVVNSAVCGGRKITVRSGGHCYEDFVDQPGVQVVIDMSDINSVEFDTERNAVAVGAGATLGQVYSTLFRRWGVTLPGGACYSVGVGGHVTGGGYGHLSRLYGLIADHMCAVEVVVVDAGGRARAVVATRDDADPRRDLWWAHTGGGGGSFGVVTRYWFRSPGSIGSDPRRLLPAPPVDVWVSSLEWPWDDFTCERFHRLVHNYGVWHERNSAVDSPAAGLAARLEITPRPGGPFSMGLQMDATAPESERITRDFLAAVNEGVGVEPAVTEFRKVPWLQSTGWPGLWASVPTDRYKYMSSYHRRSLTDPQIAGLYRGLTETDYDNPLFAVSMAGHGGKVNALAPSSTAEPHRDSVMKLLWGTGWTSSNEDQKHIGFHRNLYRAVYADTGGVPVPNLVTDGCFINYADSGLSDSAWNTSGVPWHDLYFTTNYSCLQRVKARWDPGDVFRHAQSIRLPGTA